MYVNKHTHTEALGVFGVSVEGLWGFGVCVLGVLTLGLAYMDHLSCPRWVCFDLGFMV